MSERDGALTITMIRCATLLLEWRGTRLLTDPWFTMHLRGLPCLRRPSVRPENLPELDAVLASHLHPDHFDLRALSRMQPAPRRVILTPGSLQRLGTRARRWEELAPWESTFVGDVKVTAVPAIHTFPPPEEINFVLDFPGIGAAYFGGDARFDAKLFATIARRLGPFRVALLPVGGTLILGRRTVMNPSDAAKAAEILGAETIVPIHEGGIWMSVPPLSLHPGRAAHLAARFAERGEPDRVAVLAEGASLRLEPRR